MICVQLLPLRNPELGESPFPLGDKELHPSRLFTPNTTLRHGPGEEVLLTLHAWHPQREHSEMLKIHDGLLHYFSQESPTSLCLHFLGYKLGARQSPSSQGGGED